MLLEMLRTAPRDELIQHIELQREIIQRLHQRIIDLEAALEVSFTTATHANACTSERSMTIHHPREAIIAHPSLVDDVVGSTSKLISERSSSTEHHPGPPPLRRFLNVADNTDPVPQHNFPKPYATNQSLLPYRDTNTTVSPINSSSAQATSVAAAPLPVVPPSPASVSSQGTAMEGIQDIDYVLAAHRSGRPSLPTAVVEELQHIRAQLLSAASETRRADFFNEEGSRLGQAGAHEVVGTIHHNDVAEEAVCPTCVRPVQRSSHVTAARGPQGIVSPRWVSPDASHVVNATVPPFGR